MSRAFEAALPMSLRGPCGIAQLGTGQGVVLRDRMGQLKVVPPKVLLPELDAVAPHESLSSNGDELELKELLAQLADTELEIPAALSASFRADVVGLGCMHSFAPRLKAAIEEGVEWRGQLYLPIAEWSPEACKRAWAAASEKERARWRVMICDMRLVYCGIREFERGNLMYDCAAHDAMASGELSWKGTREVAKHHALSIGIAQRLGRGEYLYDWCKV